MGRDMTHACVSGIWRRDSLICSRGIHTCPILFVHINVGMGWLRLVGSLKS